MEHKKYKKVLCGVSVGVTGITVNLCKSVAGAGSRTVAAQSAIVQFEFQLSHFVWRFCTSKL